MTIPGLVVERAIEADERFPSTDRRARALTLLQGAHERSVPVRNGCSPDAPEGGHSTHAGAPLEGAVVAVPEDPPEVAREDDVDPAVLNVLERLPEAPPVDAAPPTDADPELAFVVLEVG